MTRRYWIDLATPPQVLFFRPIWQRLQAEGHACFVTVRDFNRAPSIARHFGIPHVVVGHHGGRGTLAKGAAIGKRVRDLVRAAHAFSPDVAVSHNSYAQAVAARLLRVPFVTAMDYEHQPANHLAFRLAHRVLVPEPFPSAALRRFGAPRGRVVRYPGIKEEVYLADFKPDASLKASLGLPEDRVVVTVRPPARSALYHRFDNPLFDEVVGRLASDPSVCVIAIDRGSPDWSRFPSVQQVPHAVDGPSLLWWSDVFVGAGGTMTREAAVLGTPAYNVFAGRPSAVDDHLVAQRRMQRVTSLAEIAALRFHKKASAAGTPSNRGLETILNVLRDRSANGIA